jgi:hypothetical protein
VPIAAASAGVPTNRLLDDVGSNCQHHILSELLKEDTLFFYSLAKRNRFQLRNEKLSCMRKT